MAAKYLVTLSLLGVVAMAMAIPVADPSHHEEYEAEANFEDSPSDVEPSPDVPRDKRHLLEKIKKHHEAVFFNRGYESARVDYRPNREVHHHHYTYPAPPPYQPVHDHHHYHSGISSDYQQGYANQGSSYYSGGFSAGSSNYYPPQSHYGDGGYGHVHPPQSRPISSNPMATGHNNVDRGQGAAAVNNIAIIHARSGASTNALTDAESSSLPHSLPVNVNDALGMMSE